MNRRAFMKSTSIAGAGISLVGPSILMGRDDRVARIGIVGVGLRGREHLRLSLQRSDTEIRAICDIDPMAIEESWLLCDKVGKARPEAYQSGDLAYRSLLERDDLDGVIIATPWRWHTQMAVETMRAGKYAGLEVPAAVTLQECWDLVDSSERTGMPCMILENVCYRRDIMTVLNMVRQDLFGELVHMECGYQHDLREVKFNDGVNAIGGGVEFGEKGYSEARWRTVHSIDRNGDLYPTHGIGPVAAMLDVNRGNRFVSLSSFASKTRGLHDYIVKHGGEDHPNAKVRFRLGDVITTVLKTVRDETIVIHHDTNLPRPYSLGFRVQGTKGIWMDVNDSIYIEDRSPRPHRWEPFENYEDAFDHPLWQRHAEHAAGAGHGGMDFFVLNAFVESVRRKVAPPLDVYDAAAWSAISALSEASIALGGEPQIFPDFTRGRWMRRKPVFALNDVY